MNNDTLDTTTTDSAAVAENITITLDEPLQRGEQIIDKVTLRRPRAGELRGLSLAELMTLKVDALQSLLTRISTPTLTKPDVERLSPADLMSMGSEVVGFLLTKRERAQFPST